MSSQKVFVLSVERKREREREMCFEFEAIPH